jgi:hypothetical protein
VIHPAVHRVARRLLPVVGCAVLLAGCGSPPRPLPTAPPRTSGSVGPSGVSSAAPTVPSYPPAGEPGTLPPGGLPTYPMPTLPTRTTVPTTSPTTTRPTPSPAPRCTGGPTKQQVLDLVKGRPGIPERELTVTEGPFCSGSWQFAIVGIAGQSDDDVEPLLVLSTGRPSELRLIEAGADVCTDRVERDAPPGIRVRACGS